MWSTYPAPVVRNESAASLFASISMGSAQRGPMFPRVEGRLR